jgi:hypothetical protein
VDAGVYNVTVRVNTVNYTGTKTAVLTILRKEATISIDDLEQVYDGNPKTVSAEAEGGSVPVTIEYYSDGVLLLSAPVEAGEYEVVVTVDTSNYYGEETATFTITE